MFPDPPDRCPDCGRSYIERRRVALGNWFGEPDGHWFVHEKEPIFEGAALMEIIDECYVEFDPDE